jgi:hypothetical protein
VQLTGNTEHRHTVASSLVTIDEPQGKEKRREEKRREEKRRE